MEKSDSLFAIDSWYGINFWKFRSDPDGGFRVEPYDMIYAIIGCVVFAVVFIAMIWLVVPDMKIEGIPDMMIKIVMSVMGFLACCTAVALFSWINKQELARGPFLTCDGMTVHLRKGQKVALSDIRAFVIVKRLERAVNNAPRWAEYLVIVCRSGATIGVMKASHANMALQMKTKIENAMQTFGAALESLPEITLKEGEEMPEIK